MSGFREEVDEVNFKANREPDHDVESRVARAALDPSHVGTVHSDAVSEALLRPTPPPPQIAHSLAELTTMRRR